MVSSPAPQAGASANSATPARLRSFSQRLYHDEDREVQCQVSFGASDRPIEDIQPLQFRGKVGEFLAGQIPEWRPNGSAIDAEQPHDGLGRRHESILP